MGKKQFRRGGKLSDDRASARITVRMTDQEFADLRTLAAHYNMSVSSFVVYCISKAAKQTHNSLSSDVSFMLTAKTDIENLLRKLDEIANELNDRPNTIGCDDLVHRVNALFAFFSFGKDI